MKAVSYGGTHKVSVTHHPKPKLKTPSDAILGVTASGRCGGREAGSVIAMFMADESGGTVRARPLPRGPDFEED